MAATTATLAVAALGYGISTWAGAGTGAAGGSPETRKVTPATYGAAELRTDKGVPVAYRRLIVDSAHDCLQREVTPALIAALLKTESNFYPGPSDPDAGKEGENGIARWTPSILRWYIRADGVPPRRPPDLPSPPPSPSRP
jgi:hypothetical protein